MNMERKKERKIREREREKERVQVFACVGVSKFVCLRVGVTFCVFQ